MTDKPNAPATIRNRQPILQVIKREFMDCRSVLEIGSGTGQHAVYFAEFMPWLSWQTSDLGENHPGIRAWIAGSSSSNVRKPLLLDVREACELPPGEYDCVFSANTAHIVSIDGVRKMFDLVGRLLPPGGVFCLYGPFNQSGEFSSESNMRFDASLRSQDPSMGIRDLEVLDDFAGISSLCRRRTYAMPANNLITVWCKNRGQEAS
jgi:SAM-dependent methyltransferase